MRRSSPPRVVLAEPLRADNALLARARPSSECVVFPDTPLAREHLLVRRTLLRKGNRRLPFWGLFTLVDLPAHAFLGLYTGRFSEEDEDDGPASHYRMHLSGWTVVPPEDGEGRVDPERFPMAMLNEPPSGAEANVAIFEWSTARDAVPGIPPKTKVVVAALHTCRPVQAGEELYLHYGDQYDRRHYGREPHNVGFGCARVNRSSVPREERPRAFFERRGVASLPEDVAYVALV